MKVLLLVLCFSLLCAARPSQPISIASPLASSSWTRVNPPIAVSMWDVGGFNGQYVVAGGDCSPNNWLSVGVSEDLVNWNSQDIEDIPSDQCPSFWGFKNWVVAADQKLGYAIFNSQSYVTSPDGNTWTWHNATAMGILTYVYCNGNGTCIGYMQNDGTTYVTQDLLNWEETQSFSGYISVLNGQIYGLAYEPISNYNYVYNFNVASNSWNLYLNLTEQLMAFEDVYLLDMAFGASNSIILLGGFPFSFLKAIFVVTNMKDVECVAVFESNAEGIYYQNGALLTWSSSSYNVTLDLGATWEPHVCFPNDPNTFPVIQCSAKQVNGNFIVLGDNGLFVSSPDGKSWTTLSTGVTGDLIHVVEYNSVFYTFSYLDMGFVAIYTSDDGATWIPNGGFYPPGSMDIARPPTYIESLGGWVMFFMNQTSYQNFVKVTSDFDKFTSLSLPCPEKDVTNIEFGNGVLMIVEYVNITSTNLRYQFVNDTTGTWHTFTPPPAAAFSGSWLTYGNGVFVAVSGNYSVVTSHAEHWIVSPIPHLCYTATYVGAENGVFFCGGFWQLPVAVSKDGLSWHTLQFPAGVPTKSSNVLFDGQHYIISFAFESYMLISNDGFNWNSTDSVNYIGLDYWAFNGKVGVLAGARNNEIYMI